MNNPAPPVVPSRSCDGCTLCCKLLTITELKKPRFIWCPNCEIGVGCKIYGNHPAECRGFFCGYLLGAHLGEHWRPAASKMVLSYEEHAERIVVHVDPGRLGAWRNEPYYSEIKHWAVAAADRRGQVIVWQGPNAVAVLPDKETSLGPVRDDQLILYAERTGPLGLEIEAMVVDRDDPRAAAFIRDNPLIS